MKKIIEKYLKSGNENMKFSDFEYLADYGETNFIDRKSICDFNDIKKNKNNIKKFISKEISAFANYEGGFILIGVDDKTENIEEGIDNNYKNTTIKEWLVNLINGCITPYFSEFQVKKVEKDGKYLFVVVVGSSMEYPVQSSDNKYYSRFDDNSIPIDGFWVRNLFNRTRYSDLEPIIKIKQFKSNVFDLQIALNNTSNVASEHVCVTLTTNEGFFDSFIQTRNIRFHGSTKVVCLREIIYPMFTFEFSSSLKVKTKVSDNFVLTIQINAKNLLPKVIKYKLKDDKNGNLSLKEIS